MSLIPWSQELKSSFFKIPQIFSFLKEHLPQERSVNLQIPLKWLKEHYHSWLHSVTCQRHSLRVPRGSFQNESRAWALLLVLSPLHWEPLAVTSRRVIQFVLGRNWTRSSEMRHKLLSCLCQGTLDSSLTRPTPASSWTPAPSSNQHGEEERLKAQASV